MAELTFRGACGTLLGTKQSLPRVDMNVKKINIANKYDSNGSKMGESYFRFARRFLKRGSSRRVS